MSTPTPPAQMRTDAHNNPTAFTTDIAKEAGLKEGLDYTTGAPFVAGGHTYYTAHLLGNPIDMTIRVIDKITFYTRLGTIRWIYIGIPKFIWDVLNYSGKKAVIAFMYKHEGGTEMRKILGIES